MAWTWSTEDDTSVLAGFLTGSPSSKYVVYATACVYRELYGKIALKFASSAFLKFLWRGPRQRAFARWFHPELWLIHLKFERALKFNGRSRSHSNSNGPIRVEDETTWRAAVVADSITRTSGKPKRQILGHIFCSSRVFRPPKQTGLEWNLLSFMELLILLRFGTFPFQEKAICGVTSDQRWMEWSAFPFC